MTDAGLQPLVTYPTSGEPWRCRCLRCNTVVAPCYDNVRASGRGCRNCGPGGLRADEPAYVYLLVHHGHGALKVGVCKQHPSLGTIGRTEHLCRRYEWRLFNRIGLPSGADAYAIERDIIRWWRRDLQMPAHVGPLESEGYTETVSIDVGPSATWGRIVEHAKLLVDIRAAIIGASASTDSWVPAQESRLPR